MSQTILVLGATSAIAKEYCRIKAEANRFILVGRNFEALKDLEQDLLARQATQVKSVVYDFENISELPVLTREIEAEATVDIVLLAYGTLPDETKCKTDPMYLNHFLRVNVTSIMVILNLLSDTMRKRGDGCIAVITSVAGDRGKMSNYHYGSAKSSISTYLQGLRQELFKFGVHVLDIKPGFVDTPMTVHFKKGLLWASPQTIAGGINQAIESQKNVVYLPFFWKYIMCVIRMIPEAVFKKMKL